MDTISDTRFALYSVITSIFVGVFAYEVSIFVEYVDDLTVPCQHSTDIVEGECSCVGTPFGGTYCEESKCENGDLARSSITTPFISTEWGCRCNGQWWGFLCNVCTNTVCGGDWGTCLEGYYGDRCSSYCNATLTRDTRYLQATTGGEEYLRTVNNGGSATHCSGHGTCGDNGCECDEHYYPSVDGVSPCEATCPHHNGMVCGGPTNGRCAYNGKVTYCVCESGFVGAACERKCPNLCSGFGTCVIDDTPDMPIYCVCDDGYVSDDCSQECPSHEGVVCNDRGTCAAVPGNGSAGACTCNDGWTLDACNCNPDLTCSGNGVCTDAGCACSGNYTGAACDRCKPSYVGDTCQFFCAPGYCNDGDCKPTGDVLACNCPFGFDTSTNCDQCIDTRFPKTTDSNGNKCNVYIDALTCSNNGVPNQQYDTSNNSPKCVCHGNFSNTTDCKTCNPHFYPDGICNVECIPGKCGEHGQCDTNTGLCACDEGFSGAECDRTCDPGTCGTHGQCVANPLMDDIAFSCTCDANHYGSDCESTCPKASVDPAATPQTCNSVGACTATKLSSNVGKCFTTADCTTLFSAEPDVFCDYNTLPLSGGNSAGCAGNIELDIFIPQETSTTPYYFRTEEGTFVYPVYHAAAGLGVFVNNTRYETTLYVTDLIDVSVVPEHTELDCKHIMHEDSCGRVPGCYYTQEFCEMEMRSNDTMNEFKWCAGVLEYNDPENCATFNAAGCDTALCANAMAQSETCADAGSSTDVLNGWEYNHYLTDPWSTPSVLLPPNKDPESLQLGNNRSMTSLCADIAALPPLDTDHNEYELNGVRLNKDTIAEFQGFRVCDDTVDTWEEALALKTEYCIIEPLEHAPYSPPHSTRKMCADVRDITSNTFTTCAPGYGLHLPSATNGVFETSGTFVEFWYRTPVVGASGPRFLFEQGSQTVSYLRLDNRIYLNNDTSVQAHCPLATPNCNRFIERRTWYHVSISFNGPLMKLDVDGSEAVYAVAHNWTSFRIVGQTHELIRNLVVHSDQSCAPLYRRTEFPYGVSSNVTAVDMCQAYEALREPDDTFDFEEYCAFVETLSGFEEVFASRSDTVLCAQMHEAGACFANCREWGTGAAERQSYCDNRLEYYPNNGVDVGSPTGDPRHCIYSTESWMDHCEHMRSSNRTGWCSVAKCDCDNSIELGVAGDACQYTCTLNPYTNTPCGRARTAEEGGLFGETDSGTCTEPSTRKQLTGAYIVGECKCKTAQQDPDKGCDAPCTNYDCNLNQTSTVEARGDVCTSDTHGFAREYVREAGTCVFTPEDTNKTLCDCDDCVGFMRVGDTCTYCSNILTTGNDLVYRKTPLQHGQVDLTKDECDGRGGTFDGTQCKVNNTVVTIASCTVVFTAGECDGVSGRCECEVPMTTMRKKVETDFSGNEALVFEEYSYGTFKRVNMMQGLKPYIENHIRFKKTPTEPIAEASSNIIDQYQRRLDEFVCSDVRYAKPYEYCDVSVGLMCISDYKCRHNMCQPGEETQDPPFTQEYCKYDEMVRTTVKGRSPWTGMNCDTECPGILGGEYPGDIVGCSGHGRCSLGTCVCDDAAVMVQYKANQRIVLDGQILDVHRSSLSTRDMTGWRGIGCERQCPGYDTETYDHSKSCSGHGECSATARCVCESGWVGIDDNQCTLQCPNTGDSPNECSSHGVCEEEMVNPSLDDVAYLENIFESTCEDPHWVPMLSPELFSDNGTLPTGTYKSKDVYYSDARFEWIATGEYDVRLNFEGISGGEYALSVNIVNNERTLVVQSDATDTITTDITFGIDYDGPTPYYTIEATDTENQVTVSNGVNPDITACAGYFNFHREVSSFKVSVRGQEVTRDASASMWLRRNTTYKYVCVDDAGMFGYIHVESCGGIEPIIVPDNGYLFTQMQDHTWSIGIIVTDHDNVFTSTVFSKQILAPSYPFRLHAQVYSGQMHHFRLGVGIMFADGTIIHGVANTTDALQALDRCSSIGWQTDGAVCVYDNVKCALGATSSFDIIRCKRGNIFYADNDCNTNVKNSFVWERPSVDVDHVFNGGTPDAVSYTQTVNVFPNLRYKRAKCRCMEGWGGFDCGTCERGIGGSNCKRKCPGYDTGTICDNRGVCLWGSENGEGRNFYPAACICGLSGRSPNEYAYEATTQQNVFEGDTWIYFESSLHDPTTGITSRYADRDACTCQEGVAGSFCERESPTCLFQGTVNINQDWTCNCSLPDTLDYLEACCPFGFVSKPDAPKLASGFTDLMSYDPVFADLSLSDQNQVEKRCETILPANTWAADTYELHQTDVRCMNARFPATGTTATADVDECAAKCVDSFGFMIPHSDNVLTTNLGQAVPDVDTGMLPSTGIDIGYMATYMIVDVYPQSSSNINDWNSIRVQYSSTQQQNEWPLKNPGSSSTAAYMFYQRYTLPCTLDPASQTSTSYRRFVCDLYLGQNNYYARGAEAGFRYVYITRLNNIAVNIQKVETYHPTCMCVGHVDIQSSGSAKDMGCTAAESRFDVYRYTPTPTTYEDAWDKVNANSEGCELTEGQAGPHEDLSTDNEVRHGPKTFVHGDVSIRGNPLEWNIPEVYVGNEWRPICGEYFWDNDNGANRICGALGYLGGDIRGKNPTLPEKLVNPIMVGMCLPGELPIHCTGGQNDLRVYGSSTHPSAQYWIGRCTNEFMKVEVRCNRPYNTFFPLGYYESYGPTNRFLKAEWSGIKTIWWSVKLTSPADAIYVYMYQEAHRNTTGTHHPDCGCFFSNGGETPECGHVGSDPATVNVYMSNTNVADGASFDPADHRLCTTFTMGGFNTMLQSCTFQDEYQYVYFATSSRTTDSQKACLPGITVSRKYTHGCAGNTYPGCVETSTPTTGSGAMFLDVFTPFYPQCNTCNTGPGMPCVCPFGESFLYQTVDVTYGQTLDVSTGTYQTILGCGKCPPGTYYQDDTCTLCPTGYANNAEHYPYCYKCSAGYESVSSIFSDRKGPGATSCQKCLTSYFSLAGQPCVGCPAGFDSGLNLGIIGSTRIGYDNDNGAGLNDHCAECTAGRQWTWGFEGATGPECVNCRAGYFEGQSGQIMGTRSNWNDYPCKECVAGKYSASSATECAQCARGQFQDEMRKSGCKTCPVGFVQANEGETECAECGSDVYADEPGMLHCKQCPSQGWSMRYNDETGTSAEDWTHFAFGYLDPHTDMTMKAFFSVQETYDLVLYVRGTNDEQTITLYPDAQSGVSTKRLAGRWKDNVVAGFCKTSCDSDPFELTKGTRGRFEYNCKNFGGVNTCNAGIKKEGYNDGTANTLHLFPEMPPFGC